MRRLGLLTVLALGLAACGGSGKPVAAVEITFGRIGGTILPYSATIASNHKVTARTVPAGHNSGLPVTPQVMSSAEHGQLSHLVRSSLPNLKSVQCAGTFPDEATMFITALGKTVKVRGTCEPAFTNLWNKLVSAVVVGQGRL